MLFKWRTQNASKFGTLGSGHRTGKCQFPFQSPKRAMSKSVQTTSQLHSFHILAMKCSKSFNLGFSSTRTSKYTKLIRNIRGAIDQIANICWITEKARELKKQKQKTKTPSTSLTTVKPLNGWITFIHWKIHPCGKFLKRW